MTESITFHGAAGTVTGSRHLLTSGRTRVLLDCGQFQGLKELRQRNWAAPPFRPADVDAVVLSHAHIDHSGLLPPLVRDGFGGDIICTQATADLLHILLPDAARLQQEQAEWQTQKGTSRHRPALPLFTEHDVEKVFRRLRPERYGRTVKVARELEVAFHRAGHILGSAIVDVKTPAGWRVVFSGDLGRKGRPILRDPEQVAGADVVLVEGTYGDRLHLPSSEQGLVDLYRRAVEQGGPVLIPSFAVGRVQELLWNIRALEAQGRIPVLPVYLDSPMAVDVSEVYARHTEEYDEEAAALWRGGRSPIRPQRLTEVATRAESMALNGLRGPRIIIAGSGMATGGRILHHLGLWLPDPRATVALVGYQAAGTRGQLLQQGARTVRLLGREVVVRAAVMTLDGMSAHADQADILGWLRGFKRAPSRCAVVHAEPAAAETLAAKIRGELGWNASVARDGENLVISP